MGSQAVERGLKMRKLCALVSVVCILQAGTTVAATSIYSDRSVRLICSDSLMDQSCKAYVRAVVETWMAKDVRGMIEGQTPKEDVVLYGSANNTPQFCYR